MTDTKSFCFIMNLRLFDNTQTTLLSGGDNDLSPEMKTFYSDYLIDLVGPELIHDRFAQMHDIPKNGGKTIEFRKYTPLKKALTPLTEGVTPSGNKLDVSTIEATVKQYGDYIELSDFLLLTAIDNNLVEATKLLANQAELTLDTITREVINGGTNVLYAPAIDASGTETEKTGRSQITADCKLTTKLIFKAVAVLKTMNAKPVSAIGAFGGIIHPMVAYDLMADAKKQNVWLDVYKYANPENILNGEIGKIGGVRFFETSEAKIWEDEGESSVSVFSTLIIGENAYGTTKITGGGLKNIIKQLGSAGTSDPLDQRATTGWKATKVTERLVEEYMIRIESCSEFKEQAAN